MAKLGVVTVGVNGAVSSTVIAGVELMKKGLVPRMGMLTEKEGPGTSEVAELLNFAKLEDIVFGGWDPLFDNAYEAALAHGVFPKDQLAEVKTELEAIKPWPAIGRSRAEGSTRSNSEAPGTLRARTTTIENHLETFKKENGCENVVMVNLSSTEPWIEPSRVHASLEEFEKGLDGDSAAIQASMCYFYAATKLGIPYANFTPSLTHVPAIEQLAEKTNTPFAGMDGKTGQTLVKTALAPMFRSRRLNVEGWYSINFLGNNDGKQLESPEANKTKVMSKASVLDSIVGYKVENHQVHIHYYKPRGDAKEAWDNIDIQGFCGVPMQMKVNFLCQDSILAAPLVLDMVRILDIAKQKGEKGIQKQLSLYFKSPFHPEGETPEHDLFAQERNLIEWAKAIK